MEEVPRSILRRTSPVRRCRCQRRDSECRWAKSRTCTTRPVYCCTRIHKNERRLLTNPDEPEHQTNIKVPPITLPQLHAHRRHHPAGTSTGHKWTRWRPKSSRDSRASTRSLEPETQKHQSRTATTINISTLIIINNKRTNKIINKSTLLP